jgi:V8-like Glu-specific endopeptidase
MKTILIIFSTLLLISCNSNKLTAEDIYSKYEKSVVLIRHDFYFGIEFPDGMTLFFTELKDGVLVNTCFEVNEIEEVQNSLTGTGFFISNTGIIATNAHVTNPSVSSNEEYNIYNALKEFFTGNNYEIYSNIVNSTVEGIDQFDIQLASKNISQSEYEEVSRQRNEWYDSYLFWTELEKTNFNFNENNAPLKIYSTKLGIAYNNTFVTDITDFEDCIELSNEMEVEQDLSIIQLKNKKTPVNVKSFVDLVDKNSIGNKESLKINSTVYMIGFNSGQEVGNTTDGLLNQLTQGTISQLPDKNQVLYSIPSLPGSSGSPIFGESGELVAINYAGINNTQSFNYGILSKHLFTLFQKLNN